MEEAKTRDFFSATLAPRSREEVEGVMKRLDEREYGVGLGGPCGHNAEVIRKASREGPRPDDKEGPGSGAEGQDHLSDRTALRDGATA